MNLSSRSLKIDDVMLWFYREEESHLAYSNVKDIFVLSLTEVTRETAMQGGLVMAISGRLDWEKIFTDYIGLYSTSATYLASKEIEIGEKNAK